MLLHKVLNKSLIHPPAGYFHIILLEKKLEMLENIVCDIIFKIVVVITWREVMEHAKKKTLSQ